ITGSEFIWLDGSATLRLMFKRCKVELASIAGAHAPVRVPTSFVTTRRLRDEAVQAMIPLHVSQLWDISSISGLPKGTLMHPRRLRLSKPAQKGRSLRNGPLHEFHQRSPKGDPDAPA